MNLPRRAREVVLVAILLALPLLVLRTHVKEPTALNFLDRFVLRVSSPLVGLMAGIGRAVSGGWSRYVYLVHLESDNQRLQIENDRLRGELERAHKDVTRVDDLERQLQLRRSLPTEILAARVIGLETSSLFRVVRLRIDRGELEVRPGMAVIAPDGVVGRISRTYGPFADVQLAVDPKSAIDVVVGRTGVRGVVKGMPGDNRYRMRVDYLLRTDEVKEGDAVLTSGLGGLFPRNYVVGRVAKVTRRDFGLYQEAEVDPAVDFGRLDGVGVLLSPVSEAPRK
jgi:rod shape-determining protein MreC